MIFVGGIHGVGKSFVCKRLSAKFNLPHYSASELISRNSKEQLWIDKKISDAERNQTMLLSALDDLLLNDTQFLLDGHFSLLDSKNNISEIPQKTFVELSPHCIIVITNKVDTIRDNLYHRDHILYETSLLEDFQVCEENYSKQIARILNIPYKKWDLSKSENENEIECFLNDVLNNG
ncbi:ATP-binding protein [Salibacterium sp. K-3]